MGPTRAICRGGVCQAISTGPDGRPALVSIERRCLPAKICERWIGCALVSGNAQDGWFVDEAEQAVRGEPVRFDRVCVGATCRDVVTLDPPEAACSPAVPVPSDPAPAACFFDGAHCRPRTGG